MLEAQTASLTEELTVATGESAAAQALRDQNRRLGAELEAAQARDNRRDAVIAALRERLAAAEAMAAERVDDARTLEERLAAAIATRFDMESTLEETRARLTEALAAQRAAEANAQSRLSDAEQRQILLNTARDELAGSRERATTAEKQAELLNQQVSALRDQLGELQAMLDASDARDRASQVQLQNLGSRLNQALAQVAAEERRRRQLEESERRRLEAEARRLENFRSDFLERVRPALESFDGIRIEGDRFVFSSEVLFDLGSAELSRDGQLELTTVARIIREISRQIPEEIDWIIRVDGHTDNVPIRTGRDFSDNWELSQARALSVVRYMVNFLGIPPNRLSANGFGQYQPIDPDDTPTARAQNRRIELKLTER